MSDKCKTEMLKALKEIKDTIEKLDIRNLHSGVEMKEVTDGLWLIAHYAIAKAEDGE